jgi:glycosyltransferase involved in cell wall biosynthesis
MRKRRILWFSNFCLANTGFGKASKEFLSRLYKTGKYDIAELAAGISDLSPEVTKVPWKVYGAVYRNAHEQMQYNNADGNVKRAFDYGLMRFDEAVKDFKPDIVVAFEDLWQWCGWVKQTHTWGKFTPIEFAPLDAEPLSEEFAMFLKDFENVYTYSNWSIRIANDAGLKQVKYATLGVDTKVFKPLERHNVKLLRTQNFIKDDEFIVLMVARNQIRKKFDAVFESLNEIKKLDPSLYEKIKFIPYCQFSDVAATSAGMFFDKFWKNRKVDESKILTPYYCKACKKYHLANKYEGEEKRCVWCNTDKACGTPSVICGLSDQQLNEIYNIADVNLLATSNEGFGCSIPEGFAAGKPIITTMYSTSWEMAENSKAGVGIPCSLYNEWGTYYKKANVEPEAVAKAIIKYYHFKPERKAEMCKNAKEYVMQNHNYDLLAKQWEDILDNTKILENVDWDKKPKVKNPNPNGQVPPSSNDVEWICNLYKYILDADILEETNNQPLTNPGVQYWLQDIHNKNRTKEQIEQYFRQLAMKDLQQKPVNLMDLLDQTDTKRLLFVMPRSAGDNFIATSIVASLKEKYPEHRIYVACEQNFVDIWKNNPNVHRLLPFHPMMLSYNWGLDGMEKGFFDISFTPTILTQNNPPNWSCGNSKSFIL